MIPESYFPTPEFGEGKPVDLVAVQGKQYISGEIETGGSDSPVKVSVSGNEFRPDRGGLSDRGCRGRGMGRVLDES